MSMTVEALYGSLLSPQILGEDDVLQADDVLPGFRARVGAFFET